MTEERKDKKEPKDPDRVNPILCRKCDSPSIGRSGVCELGPMYPSVDYFCVLGVQEICPPPPEERRAPKKHYNKKR